MKPYFCCFVAFLVLFLSNEAVVATRTAALRGNDFGDIEEHDNADRKLQGNLIDGSYIIVFEDNVEDPQALMKDILKKHGGSKTFEYDVAVKGFAVQGLPPGQINKLLKTEGVKLVEQDAVLALSPSRAVVAASACTVPEQVPWGISRVAGAPSIYTGSNRAWVIDTGIDFDHPDLNVDLRSGFNVYTTTQDKVLDDLNGHGTHVSGTIAAKLDACGVVGVAPGAHVVPVK
jgi:subtilisin family serine protease